MLYNYKIIRAIQFAIETHETNQKQKRKGKDVPYITHPLTVGLILSRAGADEDTVVAGILHDTIEDSTSENKVTYEVLKKKFERKVADIVHSVSETNKSLSWDQRKEEALKDIRKFSHESLLVKSADIISNGTELIEDYKKDGDAVFARFNAPKEKILEHYVRSITAIIETWAENPLADDLRSVGRDIQFMNVWGFMAERPAKSIDYRDYDIDMLLECPVCGWRGTPRESDYINTDSHFALDVSCPNCDKMLLIASW